MEQGAFSRPAGEGCLVYAGSMQRRSAQGIGARCRDPQRVEQLLYCHSRSLGIPDMRQIGKRGSLQDCRDWFIIIQSLHCLHLTLTPRRSESFVAPKSRRWKTTSRWRCSRRRIPYQRRREELDPISMICSEWEKRKRQRYAGH
jgi:hypothetical protein